MKKAVQASVSGEAEFIAAVKEGMADKRAGRVVDHEHVVRHFEKRFKKTPKR